MKIKQLSNDYILRKSVSDDYTLYNKATDIKYTITAKLFVFLSIFKRKKYELDVILAYLTQKGISTSDIQDFLSKDEFKDILSVSNVKKFDVEEVDFYSISEKLSDFTEYSPIKIDFLITKHCNLACKHCFENSSPKLATSKASIEDIVKLFDEIDLMNVQTVKITGGEPFTYPNIKELIKKIASYRFECIILTNAMLIDTNSMKLMAENNIKLGISLDGITPEVHDYLRGRGAFKILKKQLLLLKEYGVKFSITTSVTRNNYRDINAIADYVLNTLDARRLFINQLKPLGRAKQNDDIFISESEYTEVVKEIEELTKAYGDRIVLSDDNIETDSFSTSENNPALVCAAGNTSLSIDEALNVYPCIYGNDLEEYCIGNLKETSLMDLWKSSKWDKFRGNIKLNDVKECSSCSFNSTCAVKNCRLKPVYEGRDFFSHVSYCKKK